MATQQPPPRPVKAEEVIEAMGKLLEQAKTAANTAAGACLISTQGSPRPVCVQLTPQQCAAVKGVYVGGRCP